MAVDFIAGCFGGCAGILVGHLLDTVKVRIQTHNFRSPQYKETFDCFRNIVKNESFLGLYKGVTPPPLAGIAAINAIVFGVYGNLQRNLPQPELIRSHFVAGAVAGIVQSFICSSVELAKTRMQLNQKRVFKGLNATILREGRGFGINFSTYEWLTKGDPANTAHLLAAGGASGAASWFCTYPMDVVKSRIQADEANLYKNSVDCLRKSLRSEGISCLFRGLCPTLLRAFPTNAATWAVVTWIMKTAKAEDKPKEPHGFLLELTPSVNWYPCEFSFKNLYFNSSVNK